MSIRREDSVVGLDTGSPVIHEDTPNELTEQASTHQSAETNAADGAGVEELVPLTTSKLANIGPPLNKTQPGESENPHNVRRAARSAPEDAAVKELLAKLHEQQRLIVQQREALERKEQELILVAEKDFAEPASQDNAYETSVNRPDEFAGQLEYSSTVPSGDARYPLLESRVANRAPDQTMSQSRDDNSLEDASEYTFQTKLARMAMPRPPVHRADTWPTPGYDDLSSSSIDFHEGVNGYPFTGAPGIWGSNTKSGIQTPVLNVSNGIDTQFTTQPRQVSMEPTDVFTTSNRVWNARAFSSQAIPSPQQLPDLRFFGRRASYNPATMPFAPGVNHISSAPFGSGSAGASLATAGGNDLTPGLNGTNIWGPSISGAMPQNHAYVTAIEPLNYRRLLERSVNCNWKYIVDKIVCNNDQQASIFLQQKLKIGTTDQRHAIVDAIVAQAYQLMVNRFGNFLVQRCFEYGTQEQVQRITNAIRGNAVALSMDTFGCHVIQKALDCVSEEFKTTMVNELLRRIPETVVHRYACHVWQKLFELRWVGKPPQIMKYVNEALHGMWHDVALGETGSLVVQNIFENCLEQDKRPCIGEILEYIDMIARGQFGNWCIQHICEHGAPHDRTHAIDTVIQNAVEYSMDQYASKVVEKCLKIGGNEFLDRYLDRVCEGRPDRSRIPLIDIASDQHGNYLVQWILQHASVHHREQVASHIRKHMVSLRGSKFGSRVGMLCCNPIYNRQAGGPPSPASRFARFGFR